jgi:ribosome-binding protein aMBF1 (putative translation factor)
VPLADEADAAPSKARVESVDADGIEVAVEPALDAGLALEQLAAGEVTGLALRAVRESQGLSLEELASRTKITVSQLRAIESESFRALPAAVYVRGFVFQLAKVLKLDAERVAKGYVARYKRALPSE